MTGRIRFNIILLLIAGLCGSAGAQDFKNSCALDTVTKTGFYRIRITPGLSAFLKTDLSDLRISDANDQPVPFLIDYPYEKRVQDPVLFDLSIISNTTKNGKTEILFENNHSKKITNLLFEYNNTSATRRASLSGSDNGKNWFTIIDSFLIIPEPTDGLSRKTLIKTPATSYHFYKLQIENSNKDPLKLLNVSYSEIIPGDTAAQYIPGTPLQFVQKDTAGYTLLTITGNEHRFINKLSILAESPKYFERGLSIFLNPKPYTGDFISALAYYTSTISSSDTDIRFPETIKCDTLYILIENRDNPPLKIRSVTTWQNNISVISWLQDKNHYRLLLNNPEAKAPQYDLQKFRDSIGTDLPVLNTGSVKQNDRRESFNKNQERKNQWLWPVIILIILLLGSLSWKLINDLNKRAS